jgi:hypothetical protein
MPLTTQDIQYHFKWNEKLKETRMQYEPLWEEIATYFAPWRIGISYKTSPGQKQTTQLYDSTGIFSLDQLGSTMCGTITPSSMVWAYLKLAKEELNHIKPIMDWEEDASARLHWSRKNSNFYAEAPALYEDLAGFGQGCLFADENPINKTGFNGFYYKTIPNSEYCTAEDHQGFVDTVFREFTLSARAAYKKWGDNLPKKLQEYADLSKDPEKELKFLHCAYPNPEPKGLPFISYYFSIDEKELISEKGFYELPFIVPRLRKSSGEGYGRGQGHIALPDCKSLNKAKELDFKAWAIDINPPTFETNAGVVGSLKLYAGGRNVVKNKDSIWMLERNVKYNVSQIKEEELIKAIKQMFYSDQFNLPEKGEMREVEVMIRYELMQRLLGPAVGRIEVEFLKKLVEREFGIMYRAKAMPPIPPIFAQLGIRNIDIEYEGPLSRSRRMAEAQGIQKLYAFAGGIAQAKQDPSVMDALNDDEAIRTFAEISGAPSRVMKSKEEVDAIRKQRQEMMMAEKKKQDMERLVGGINQITPALELLQNASQGKVAEGGTT